MSKYKYISYNKNLAGPVATLKGFDVIRPFHYTYPNYVEVIDDTGKHVTAINHEEDFLAWSEKLEKDSAWKPHKWDPLGEAGIETKELVETLHKIKNIGVEEPSVAKYLGKTPVNPKHYQGFFVIPELDLELQWLESVQYKGVYKDPNVFKPSVLLQADKYLSRLGGKDEEVQEIMKGIWYLKFVAAYIKNGNKPIRVVDIEKILGDEV